MTRKIALITGANGGLGTHVTKAFLDAGFTVVGLSPKIQQSDFDHPNFIALPASLNSLGDAKKAVASVIDRCGKIDVLAHLVGGFTEPAPKIGAYSASKAALVSLIETVALENKDAGITANVILPGTMDTPANRKDMPTADASKWVQPASVASLVVWLAGDAGKDVTGAAIPVYGSAL
jgi:NAD(P)-dependent dehydrogenase (short-subunit alcohol dehydrogenase family)